MQGKCFRITDAKAIRGNTSAELFGVKCNYDEWKKHQFCPTKGVIGQILCDARIAEGTVYIIECMCHYVVPILTWGLEEISSSYFKENYLTVNAIGYDPTGSRCDEAKSEELMNSLFNGWGM